MGKWSKSASGGVPQDPPVVSARQLFTTGYEGCDPASFVQALLANRIETLVDVRQRAASRKPGFAKTRLRESVTAAGIRYVHMPLLGTLPKFRKRLHGGELELDEYLQLYREHAEEQESVISELEQMIQAERCCLVCVEADPAICHRTVLANLLVERSPDRLSVHNIVSKGDDHVQK